MRRRSDALASGAWVAALVWLGMGANLSAQILLPGMTLSGPGIEAANPEFLSFGGGASSGYLPSDFFLDGTYGGQVVSGAWPNVLSNPYYSEVPRFTLTYQIQTGIFIGDITEFSLSGFAHYSLYSMEWVEEPGQLSAVSVTRSEGDGDLVTFTFGPPYAPIPVSSRSAMLIIHTDATQFTTGFATLTTSDGPAQVEVLVPATAAVPEPKEVMIAAGAGLLALAGWRCRRSRRE